MEVIEYKSDVVMSNYLDEAEYIIPASRKLYILTNIKYTHLKVDICQMRRRGFEVLNNRNYELTHRDGIDLCDVVQPKFDITEHDHPLAKWIDYAIQLKKPILSRFIIGKSTDKCDEDIVITNPTTEDGIR